MKKISRFPAKMTSSTPTVAVGKAFFGDPARVRSWFLEHG
jgi:hypothetical protein